jgi:hypothetical protein
VARRDRTPSTSRTKVKSRISITSGTAQPSHCW